MSIEAVIKTYEAALNAGDVDAIMSLYSDEPVFMPEYSIALVGREAVRSGYEAVFAAIKLNVAFTIHEVDTTSDLAWMRTSSRGRTRVLTPGVEVDEGNNELFVFRREPGGWKIHRYLFATNLPRN